MSIIIVDEFQDEQFSVIDALSGYSLSEIFLFKSTREAFCYLNLDRPEEYKDGIDVILLNVKSDEISGIDACEMVHAHDVYRYIPIILLLDGTDIDQLEELSEAGTIDFLIKPFKRNELVARVKLAMIAKKEIEQRRAYENQHQKIVDELTTINEDLQDISFLDSLAGISNRRHFDEIFPREWQKARRNQASITILMIDIDFFKNFNDLYGHQKGDECIKTIASIIGCQLKRQTDMVARYGGEEFVLVLPSTKLAGGKKVADRIQTAIKELQMPHTGSLVNDFITVSIGIASEVPSEGEPGSLIKKADQALYTAKKEGRNRTISIL